MAGVVRADNDPEVLPDRWYRPPAAEEMDRMTDELNQEAAMLRATSDGLMLAINEIQVREGQKRGVPPSDPAFTELARDVRLAAEVILELARKEEATAELTAQEPHVDRLPPIGAVAPGANLAAILEQWRAIESRMQAAPPGTPEARELMIEFQRLRKAYADAVESKRSNGGAPR